MEQKHIVLAGGSGFLGQSLASFLVPLGYQIVVLTRSPRRTTGPICDVGWDGRTLGDWAQHLDGAAAVVNLTGRSVNCRYTPANRREINQSRVDSVHAVGAAIRQCQRPPKVLIQASSLAIYGDAGERICDETAPPGQGFPVETCLLWEETFRSNPTPHTRRVLLRIGFVLGRRGGALGTLEKLTQSFLGGRVGSGRQYISWLHIDDFNRMVQWAVERDDVEGLYNATGPHPVTNAEFMRTLRRALRRPWSPPTPAVAAHLGAWLMRTEACLALTGRRCIPRRFLDHGFEFSFPELPGAFENLYRDGGPKLTAKPASGEGSVREAVDGP